jgi:hypothetical protein
MLSTLITSKTRVRLLVKFFLNPTMKAYLRQLAEEFGESTNSLRIELNRLTEAGLLESYAEPKNKINKLKYSFSLFFQIEMSVNELIENFKLIEVLNESFKLFQKKQKFKHNSQGLDLITGVIH